MTINTGKTAADGSERVTVVGGDINLTADNLTVDAETKSTAADPSYIEGSTNSALSTDLSGHLRVKDAAVVSAVSTASGNITTAIANAEVTLGQAAMASSVPVVLASDQSSIPVTGTVNPTSNSYRNITTSTTTTVKASAGVLHAITLNSAGTVASSVVVYDNTAASGTKIASINSLTPLGALYIFDVAFATGLTVVTTGTVAPDITVSYR